MDSDSALIRKGSPVDAHSIGRIFVRARDAMTYLPRIADQDRPKLGGWITARHEIRVIEDRDRIMGFAGLSKGWLDHLYIDPDCQNLGLGAKLLREVQRLQPTGTRLWRFYEHHGFRLETLTDGSRNMEREPDALYVWEP
jgi:GNAT superfamily N-acetyltransferase